MKQLPILFSIIFISISVNGQQFRGKIKNLKMIKEPGMVYAFNYPNAKLLYETEKGKVFQLPPDNMRCLAPNYRSNMPYAKINPQLLLNPLPRLKIIQKSNPDLIPQEKIIPFQSYPEPLSFSNHSPQIKIIPLKENAGK